MQEEYINKGVFAFNAMKSNDVGIQGILRELFVIFSSIISIILMAAILTRLHISILICCIIPVVLSAFLQKYTNKMNFQFSKTMTTISRKTENMMNLLYDVRNGKEFRIYDSNKLILHKYISLMKEQKKQQNNNSWKNQAFMVCNMIIDKGKNITIYLILIYFCFQRNLSIGDFKFVFMDKKYYF